MKSVPLSSQNTAEFTPFLPFSQHNRLGVWERLRAHFSSSRCKMAESHSTCINLKRLTSCQYTRELARERQTDGQGDQPEHEEAEMKRLEQRSG
jgi:hypothetical protein